MLNKLENVQVGICLPQALVGPLLNQGLEPPLPSGQGSRGQM